MVNYTRAIKSSLARLLLGKQQRWPFNEDGLATNHVCDFLNNERFRDAYAAAKQTSSWDGVDIHWRAYVVAWAAMRGLALEGDFVECGVNRGGTAMMAATYTSFRHARKTFWLLDTFKGLDEKYVTREEKEQGILVSKGKKYPECYDLVKANFKDFPNVRIIRGSIPETLSQVTANKVAYLSIDMNCVTPEIAALEYFWDKLVSEATVVLDDYGFRGHKYQKKGFDEFASKHGVEVLTLPTGQGMMIK